jgi:hypothetical protein
MWWWLVPVVVLGAALSLFGVFVFLGRFRQGALLRPLVERLSRIGFMRRFFQRVSTAAIERQNPDLASAIRKMSPVAANPNPQVAQKALSRLTAAERRAYLEAAQEQGAIPAEASNRQMRRQLERQQQQTRPGGGSSGRSSGSARKRKRR